MASERTGATGPGPGQADVREDGDRGSAVSKRMEAMGDRAARRRRGGDGGDDVGGEAMEAGRGRGRRVRARRQRRRGRGGATSERTGATARGAGIGVDGGVVGGDR